MKKDPQRDLSIPSELETLRRENARLRERLEQHHRLHELLGNVIYRNDFRQDTYAEISSNVERMTGIPAEQITTHDWAMLADTNRLTGEAAHLTVQEAIEKYHSGEISSWSQEYRIQARDGVTRWVRDLSVPVYDEGGNVCASFGMISDTTELHQMHEQLVQVQKMDSLGRMAGGIAHDFNNLLTAILGYSELIESDADPDSPTAKYIKNIRRAGERSAELVAQLLAFARRQVLTPQILDLNKPLTELEPIFRQLLGGDIRLEMSLQPELWKIKADAVQCQQVFVNLVVNGRDAMPTGGTLTLTTENLTVNGEDRDELPPGDYVLLTVTDTGMGMDRETQQHLFEPFFTTKPVGQGTGLGLATCHGIVKQSGGCIVFESEPERGTTFRVYFPRTNETQVSNRQQMSLVSERNECLLLAEDDEMVRQLAMKALTDAGYRAIGVRDGMAALETLQNPEISVDLLITDLKMPRLGGKELAKRAKRLFPKLKVLFITGNQEADTVESFSTLPKPYSAFQLRLAVRKALNETTE